jgi:hypothetical protein
MRSRRRNRRLELRRETVRLLSKSISMTDLQVVMAGADTAIRPPTSDDTNCETKFG